MREPVLRLDDAGRAEASRILASGQRSGVFPHNPEVVKFYDNARHVRNVEIDRMPARKLPNG